MERERKKCTLERGNYSFSSNLLIAEIGVLLLLQFLLIPCLLLSKSYKNSSIALWSCRCAKLQRKFFEIILCVKSRWRENSTSYLKAFSYSHRYHFIECMHAFILLKCFLLSTNVCRQKSLSKYCIVVMLERISRLSCLLSCSFGLKCKAEYFSFFVFLFFWCAHNCERIFHTNIKFIL